MTADFPDPPFVLRERELARLPIDFVLHLMANGWAFDVDSQTFTKGGHGIVLEALADFCVVWGGFLPYLKKAISKGAVGFKVVCVEKLPDRGLLAHVEYEWPDVVTRLGEVAGS